MAYRVMGYKDKLSQILIELEESFQGSKLLDYMDFNSNHFIFRAEAEFGKISYNYLASYNPEEDRFYLLKELFTPGVLDKQQRIQNRESQKRIVMHEEVHRAVIKSGLLDKYINDPVISSTSSLDKYHSLPFVLASLKFDGYLSNYIYDEDLKDFRNTFSSVERFVEYISNNGSDLNLDNLYLLDFRNSKDSAGEIARKLSSKNLKFRDGTMFAVNGKQALVYFKKAFYTIKLNDNKKYISITYKRVDY